MYVCVWQHFLLSSQLRKEKKGSSTRDKAEDSRKGTVAIAGSLRMATVTVASLMLLSVREH